MVVEDRTIAGSISNEREVAANRVLLANARGELEEMFISLGNTDDNHHPFGGMLAGTHGDEASGSGVIYISSDE